MAETMNKSEALKEANKLIRFLEVFKNAATVIQLSLQADQDYHRIRLLINEKQGQTDKMEAEYALRLATLEENYEKRVSELGIQEAALMAEYEAAHLGALEANAQTIAEARGELLDLQEEVAALAGQRTELRAELANLKSDRDALATSIQDLLSRLKG